LAVSHELAFSLTPALSRWERGSRSPVLQQDERGKLLENLTNFQKSISGGSFSRREKARMRGNAATPRRAATLFLTMP
jgi:hypothetical protein